MNKVLESPIYDQQILICTYTHKKNKKFLFHYYLVEFKTNYCKNDKKKNSSKLFSINIYIKYTNKCYPI